jgi:hypothetical protein
MGGNLSPTRRGVALAKALFASVTLVDFGSCQDKHLGGGVGTPVCFALLVYDLV